MRPFPLIAALVAAATTLTMATGAATGPATRIVLGHSIGYVRLGMTAAAAKRYLHGTRTVPVRRKSLPGGDRYVEYQYLDANFNLATRVGYRVHSGTARVIFLATEQARYRTDTGVGVGTRKKVLLNTYRPLRCREVRTNYYTLTPLCVLRAPRGHETSFTLTPTSATIPRHRKVTEVIVRVPPAPSY